MELWELKDCITNNNIPNLLIFDGPEIGLMDIYINQIGKVLKSNIKRMDSVAAALSSSKIITLADSNKVSLIRGDKTFQTSEKLQEKAKNFKNYIIVIYDSLDKRSKLYKEFADNIVTFNFMDEKTLLSLLSRQINLTQDNIKWIMQACGFNYNRCLLEIKKLNLFNADKDALLKQFREDGVIYEEIGDIIFQFVDAVTRRKKQSSWKLYELLKLKGESNIKIISLLYSNFRAQLSVQFCNNPTTENTGLTPYQITLNKNKRGIYSDKELINIMELLKTLDSNIKNGIMEETITIEYLLANIL